MPRSSLITLDTGVTRKGCETNPTGSGAVASRRRSTSTHRSTNGIILDIRFNPGGESSNAYDVVSYFIDAPVKASMWKSLKYVPAYRSWGKGPEWELSDPDIVQPRDGHRSDRELGSPTLMTS